MSLGSHQQSIGKNDARFTPRYLLDPLGEFDTDVCAGDPRPWDIATRNITAAENSLLLDWKTLGRKWCNAPFNRYQVGAFVTKMCEANHGILLLHVRTETEWFKPIWDAASALLFLAGRVIFCKADGSPCTIENPKAKHFGKSANSGAPVMLAAFGFSDADCLDQCGIDGAFVPLRFARFVLIQSLEQNEQAASWRKIVTDWLKTEGEPVAVAELYRAFRLHPKSKHNPNWKAKLRQTLQRGAGRSVGRDQWVAATAGA